MKHWLQNGMSLSFPSDDSVRCNCILLKNCETFNEFIDLSSDIPFITRTIKEAICNFDGTNIYVCCPARIPYKRHAKGNPKLDYLDELTGLNCPPSFGEEYNYDEYLRQHPEADIEGEDDASTTGKESGKRERVDINGVLCSRSRNCVRFKFPTDDAPTYPRPTPHPDYHGYDHNFAAPLYPFNENPHRHHHHHHHYHYDYHGYNIADHSQEETFVAPKTTPPPQNVNSETSVCGILPKGQSSEVYPWIVRLAYLNTTSRTVRHRCLGTIISRQHILTAAHCVDNLVRDLRLIYARVGDDTNFQDFKIIETTIHPDYNDPLFNNDVALVRLAKTHNSKIPLVQICLPQNDSEIATGNTGIVAGWSDNANSNVAISMVRYINLPILNNTECAIRYAKYSENFENSIVITPSEFCAQSEAKRDVCEGDSGGPFMNRSKSGQYTLLGIVAFGPKTNCGQSNLPGVYMRVSSYVDWIQQNIS
ncbi:CLIP domain-containing serine protease B4 [Musca vetustissima]|uniref:CLIP domain-containing serine protease B4 n=1 Tax=Musca vetustissima TaxID=27455 RepID=UPI002AB6F68C|nr:CLIP domain-containing serine protease B4 [Musca vetustissima]